MTNVTKQKMCVFHVWRRFGQKMSENLKFIMIPFCFDVSATFFARFVDCVKYRWGRFIDMFYHPQRLSFVVLAL